MSTVAGTGALRIAEALFYGNGSFFVTLRLPGVAGSGSGAEELGLCSPLFQEVPMGPAVWRAQGSTSDLLISAAAVSALAGSGGFASAEILFQQAVGVLADGVLYTVQGAEPLMIGGTACAYRVSLRAPTWN